MTTQVLDQHGTQLQKGDRVSIETPEIGSVTADVITLYPHSESANLLIGTGVVMHMVSSAKCKKEG